jgi:hypothetical protein
MQKIAYNHPLPSNNAVNSNEQKKETWFSKNAPLLCGVTVGVIALAVIWKWGQSKEQTWQPLTDKDTTPVDFDWNEHLYVNGLPKLSQPLATTFNNIFYFCVNHKLENTHAECANRALNAKLFADSPSEIAELEESAQEYFFDHKANTAQPFEEIFPTLRVDEKGELSKLA